LPGNSGYVPFLLEKNMGKLVTVEFKKKMGGHDKQERVYRETCPNILINATRRGGKDYVAARKAVKNIFKDLDSGKGREIHSWRDDIPKLHYWAIGLTYKHADILKRYIIEILLKMGMRRGVDFTYDASNKKLWLLHWDVLIEFKTSERPDLLVGEGVAGALCTEVARWKQSVWFDNVQAALMDNDGWAIMTTTPKGNNWVYHQIYKVCIDGITREPVDDERCDTRRSWVYYHWTFKEQTMIKGFLERVQALEKIMPPEDFARNFLAEWTNYAGRVLSGFTDSNLVTEFDATAYRFVFGGFDSGHTHRAGIVVVGVTYDWQVHVLEAIGESGLMFMTENKEKRTMVSIIRELQKQYKCDMWYTSHERPESIKTLKDVGIPARSWMKSEYTKNEGVEQVTSKVLAGFQFVNRLLYSERMKLKYSHKELINDCNNFMYKEMPDGGYNAEKLVDEYNDVADALRYAVWSNKKVRREINKLIAYVEDIDDEFDDDAA